MSGTVRDDFSYRTDEEPLQKIDCFMKLALVNESNGDWIHWNDNDQRCCFLMWKKKHRDSQKSKGAWDELLDCCTSIGLTGQISALTSYSEGNGIREAGAAVSSALKTNRIQSRKFYLNFTVLTYIIK